MELCFKIINYREGKSSSLFDKQILSINYFFVIFTVELRDLIENGELQQYLIRKDARAPSLRLRFGKRFNSNWREPYSTDARMKDFVE